MSRKVLISLLGRAEKRDGVYRTTCYKFPDGSLSEPTAFLGWELFNRTCPDAMILIGTQGSMWAWLHADSLGSGAPPLSTEELERLLPLNEAVANQRVTQQLLDQSTPTLKQALGCDVHPILISDCQTTAEQHDLLLRLAPFIEQGDSLTLDLTHSFRHHSLLLMMASVYLRSVRSASIAAMYTSFYDSDTGLGTVFDLEGLHALLEWQDALSSFRKDGDPGVFAPLLEADHASPEAVRELSRASYFSRVFRHESAWKAERTVANQLERHRPSGISGLYVPELIAQLGQRDGAQTSVRLAELARRQLELGSYDRAVLLGLAAAQAKNVQGDESLDDVHYRLTQTDPNPDYVLLNGIRNSIAHTSHSAQRQDAEKALKGKEILIDKLTSLFKHLI